MRIFPNVILIGASLSISSSALKASEDATLSIAQELSKTEKSVKTAKQNLIDWIPIKFPVYMVSVMHEFPRLDNNSSLSEIVQQVTYTPSLMKQFGTPPDAPIPNDPPNVTPSAIISEVFSVSHNNLGFYKAAIYIDTPLPKWPAGNYSLIGFVDGETTWSTTLGGFTGGIFPEIINYYPPLTTLTFPKGPFNVTFKANPLQQRIKCYSAPSGEHIKNVKVSFESDAVVSRDSSDIYHLSLKMNIDGIGTIDYPDYQFTIP